MGTPLKLQKKSAVQKKKKKHAKPNYTEEFTVQSREARKRSHPLVLWRQRILVIRNGMVEKRFYHGLCRDG